MCSGITYPTDDSQILEIRGSPILRLCLFCTGEMKRANSYEEDRRTRDRFASTLVIAAPIIAAVLTGTGREHQPALAQAHGR